MASEPDTGVGGEGRRRAWPDVVLGLATLPCVALLYAESTTFRKMDWEPLGMAFWPQVCLGILAVLSVWFIFRGLTRWRETDPLLVKAFVPWIAGIVFTALLPLLGTYLAGVLLIIALTLYLKPAGGRSRGLIALANGVVSLGLIHLIFSVILGLRMPTGLLGV